MKNGTARVCWFLLLTAIVLIGIGQLPPLTIGGYKVRCIDVLAKILPDQQTPEPATTGQEHPQQPTTLRATTPQESASAPDSVAADFVAAQGTVFIDTVPPPPDMVPIEDFTPMTAQATQSMDVFYAALDKSRGQLGRPVRIAFFGDSFVEGDILTADLRQALQQAYGGEGVGYVDIASPFIQYKGTVRHSATGWTDHSILERSKTYYDEAGISGRYATAQYAGASVRYSGVSQYAGLASWSVATAYVSADDTLEVTAFINDTDTVALPLAGNGQVQALCWEGRISKIRLTAPTSGFIAYGMALEGRSGVTVDNFSLRGCNGTALTNIPRQQLRQFARLRPYDLIVLQFGLNIAEKDRTDYTAYTAQMRRVIEHLRTAYPHAAILVMSVGDRADRIDGELRTIPGVKALVRQQRQLAMESGVAFWNTYEAMGGEGSILRMASLGQAGKDYTHITRSGGKAVAQSLMRALQFGHEQYSRKTHYLQEQYDQE